MITIGCDVHVSRKTRERLESMGYFIVNAYHGEEDVAFFKRALKGNASIFISEDQDIEMLCKFTGMKYFNQTTFSTKNKLAEAELIHATIQAKVVDF